MGGKLQSKDWIWGHQAGQSKIRCWEVLWCLGFLSLHKAWWDLAAPARVLVPSLAAFSILPHPIPAWFLHGL